ncbi:RNA-directed DNA polymerase [Methanosarcina sp. Mfa9]|uniref:RNA-directed DNA polymerase n=1 Tax=Methanosarcina sp. Mfa9 TaxID=3439063 RepID=UPI003F844AE2
MGTNTQSVKLTRRELNASLSFLENYGYSIFLPEPFEIRAIRNNWSQIVPLLEKIELRSYDPQQAIKIMAPKKRYTVRPIHLLNPIDIILFTGLVYRLGPIIETTRRENNNRVFSKRFKLKDTDGNFELEDKWDLFVNNLGIRASKYKMVAKADIVDFFPRIYLHRLQNSISSICREASEVEGEMEHEIGCLMNFLGTWSDGTSYGIPIGPLASNLLAEAYLTQIDRFLDSLGIDYVRYIDDYYMFANSESECIKILYELGERLNDEHLSLNEAKTYPMPTSELMSSVLKLKDPSRSLRKKVIKNVFNGNPYAFVNYDDLTPEQKQLIDEIDVEELMEGALNSPVTDFAEIEFVLQVLSALKRPDLVHMVIENLERLSPISNSVANFLNVFDEMTDNIRIKTGKEIISFLNNSAHVTDFQFIWLLEPFIQCKEWNNIIELRKIIREHTNPLVKRQAILSIGTYGYRSPLLDIKPKISQTYDWERRAIMYACRNLPFDEQDTLYRQLGVKKGWTMQNILDKATLVYGQSTRNRQ